MVVLVALAPETLRPRCNFILYEIPFSAYLSNYLSNHLSNYLSIVTISNICRHIGYCLVLNGAGFIIEKTLQSDLKYHTSV